MMKNITLALSVIFVGCNLFAAENGDKSNKIICNKKYKIVAPNGDKDMGTYGILAVQKKWPEKNINITETMSMDYRGKKAEYKSSVIYNSNPPISPESATAETKVDGKVCMKGTVTFSEKTVSFNCTGFLNKRTGEAIDPPKKFEKKDQPKPQGVLIFQSALPTIGPRLLSKEGELKDVVFVEFPDDIGAPELINFKEGYRLVREEPDDKGEYNLKIYSPHSEDSISHIRYNKNDQIVSIASFGKMKLREVEEKK
ncbi:hypothetical protein OAV71_02650 [Opitutales bacterium]|nr:hypothetical protein [Opitutales bacterium]